MVETAEAIQKYVVMAIVMIPFVVLTVVAVMKIH